MEELDYQVIDDKLKDQAVKKLEEAKAAYYPICKHKTDDRKNITRDMDSGNLYLEDQEYKNAIEAYQKVIDGVDDYLVSMSNRTVQNTLPLNTIIEAIDDTERKINASLKRPIHNVDIPVLQDYQTTNQIIKEIITEENREGFVVRVYKINDKICKIWDYAKVLRSRSSGKRKVI